ncbi:MAG: biopolymer transporter ExbD [Candidatus Marinimicrobia bacterium]|nr:biopolymer transporter ExbD [Candidatus Neomarinimicrobiota bacterium]
MKFSVRNKPKSEISTASMPDIIFMLLVFFMVTTVLREYEGLPIALPSATKIEKLESKRNTAHLWVNKVGLVSIDDKRVPMPAVRHVIYAKLAENPKLITSLKADKETTMRIITDLHQELRNANALKVNYSAKTRVN